jgi:hypothetical protein
LTDTRNTPPSKPKAIEQISSCNSRKQRLQRPLQAEHHFQPGIFSPSRGAGKPLGGLKPPNYPARGKTGTLPRFVGKDDVACGHSAAQITRPERL